MSYYIRLKGIALGGLVGLFGIIYLLSTFSSPSAPTQHDRTTAVDIFAQTALPTSDAVPLPTCRFRYINMSSDEAYPIPHWVYSLPRGSDKALILAIARNESKFKPYARSHKGAVGLMQLMPETATYMVKQQRSRDVHLASINTAERTYMPRNPFDFRDPYVSLAVGERYIRYLQDKNYIGDNIVYTLAAYNAGPGNLLKWKRAFGTMSDAAFASRIPYRETREYVRNVMRDYLRYQKLLPPIQNVVWTENDKC
jgi:Transglycosylase SLT domain